MGSALENPLSPCCAGSVCPLGSSLDTWGWTAWSAIPDLRSRMAKQDELTRI